MKQEKYHTVLNALKESYFIFTKSEKIRAVKLIMMAVLCSFFEFISIGALFPYIKIISHPEVIHDNKKLNYLYHLFHMKSEFEFFVLIGLGIMGLILLKAAIGVYNNYVQTKFSADVKNRIASNLFSRFMYLPLSKVLKEKSTFYSKYLLYDVENFFCILSALLKIVTNFLMMSALVALMLMVSPFLLMLSLFLLGGLVLLCIRVTKERSHRLGKQSEVTYRYLYRCIDESLKGVKDIQLFKVEDKFIRNFMQLQRQANQQRVSLAVMANIPMVAINTLGFGVLLAIVLIMLLIHGNILNILPTLGIIALSVQRLLPGMTLITASLSTVRTYSVVIFKLSDLLNESHHYRSNRAVTKDKPVNFKYWLGLQDVVFSYKEGSTLFNKLSIRFKKNCITGIIGKSGSGKSTLIDILLGLYPISSGAIICDDKPLEGSLLSSYKDRVAYISQKPFILDTTLKNNIAFGEDGQDIDLQRLKIAIQVSQLQDIVDDFPNGSDEELGEDAVNLSGGQKQRVGIARAIYNDADLIIFDESTSALDVETERNFYKALKQWSNQQKTIIIISHRKTLLECCDHIVIMRDGKVVNDNDKVDDAELLAEVDFS